jgi:hypothetical protein
MLPILEIGLEAEKSGKADALLFRTPINALEKARCMSGSAGFEKSTICVNSPATWSNFADPRLQLSQAGNSIGSGCWPTGKHTLGGT